MSQREEQIAGAIMQMRDPLACVELAASQLSREALTPAARSLAARISQAVVQIDERISDSLEALRPSRGDQQSTEDGRIVLDAIRERMKPVLRAHGIRWDARAAVEETPVVLDSDLVRKGAFGLLRAGIALAEERGRIALSFVSARAEQGRGGHGIQLEVGPVAPDAPQGDESLRDARHLALRLGGSLEIRRAGESVQVVLRFAAAESS